MTEIAERASPREQEDFLDFLYFRGTIKHYPHEIIMSRRKGRNGRKSFAEGDEDFLDFLYFFDERSGKADDCGTIKIGTIKHYPHEIIMSHRKNRKDRKGCAE